MFTTLFKISTWILCLLLPLLTTSVYGASLSSQLPDIGTAGSSTLTPREEKQLGHEFMRNVRQNLTLLNDTFAVDYLQSLADKLQPKSGEYEHDIKVFLVDDPSINAFAGPGGYIGIHTGLLLSARSEGELASVMAHEIAHVSQRHLVRAFETSNKMSLASMGAILAGIILGNTNPEISEAVIASTVAGSAQQQLTFSRSHEQEADRVGLELLANAGFDPRNMVSFFEVLQQKQRTVGGYAPEFLLTHPLTLSRIADTRNRASQYPQDFLTDNTTLQLIQARVSTLQQKTGPNPFLRVESAQERPSELSRRYYQALLAAAAGNYSQARQHITPLVQLYSQRVLFHYSAAQIELGDNKPDIALKITQNAVELFPGSTPLIELHARILLQINQQQQAFEVLQSAIRRYPERYDLYQTYAEAASKAGNNAEAYRALAEYQYQLGNIRQSISYLTQALESDNLGKYERISIDARLDELKTEALSREQIGREANR